MAFTTPFAVKLVPFKLGTSEGYKVILKDHTTVGYEEFLSEVAKGSQLPLALVRGVWDNGIDVATEEMRSGKRVAVGFGDLYMVARGSVQDPTESLKDNKNVYLAAVMELVGALQSIAKSMPLVNQTDTVALWLHEIVEEGHTKADENKLFTANTNIVINTVEGTIVPERADEGVWLCDAATGEKLVKATVVETSPTVTIIKFASLPEAGKYTLLYCGRNGEAETKTLASKTRQVTVVAAE